MTLYLSCLVSSQPHVRAAAPEGIAAASGDWSAVDQILQSAIATGVFPGCTAAVGGQGGSLLYVRAFGAFTYGVPPPYPGGAVVQHSTVGTLYDLASVTKVAAATSAAMLLYERGLLSIEALVSDASLLGPGFAAAGKGAIRVRNLLLHNAGFPLDPSPHYSDPAFGCPGASSWTPPLSFGCAARVYGALLNQTLTYPVGSQYVYSDVSFITMHYVIGRIVEAQESWRRRASCRARPCGRARGRAAVRVLLRGVCASPCH